MITTEQIQNALYDWAFNALNQEVPFVWFHQNMARPTVPYIAGHLSTARPNGGKDYVSLADDNGVLDITGNREFTLMLQAFGTGSEDNLRMLTLSLSDPTIQFTLEQAGIVIVDVLPINDISALVGESRFEERNQMDVLLGRADTYRTSDGDDGAGVIETVNIETTHKSGTDERVVEQTVEALPDGD